MKQNLTELLVNQPSKLFRELNLFNQNLSRQRTHHYQASDVGQSFVIEPSTDEKNYFVMTSQRAGIHQGDYITIHNSPSQTSYQVVEVDHYCSGLPDLWIAKLAQQ